MTAQALLKERTCEYTQCGQRLIRRENEPSSNWKRRKYCSTTCQTSSRRLPLQTKPCEECGTTIVRTHVNKREWEKRRWCSRACRYAKNPQRDAAKQCETCAGEFQRGNRAVVDFNAQRYCSQECNKLARRNEDPPPLAGPHVKYDIDNPPPCFLDAEFFEEEEDIKALLSRPGRKPEGLLASLMDNVRNIWCLDCPILSECAEWGVESKHDGIAGGEWMSEGEVQ